jgi:hypothetical protein
MSARTRAAFCGKLDRVVRTPVTVEVTDRDSQTSRARMLAGILDILSDIVRLTRKPVRRKSLLKLILQRGWDERGACVFGRQSERSNQEY